MMTETKKQEFKDFSLSEDVLINELTESEITSVLSVEQAKQVI